MLSVRFTCDFDDFGDDIYLELLVRSLQLQVLRAQFAQLPVCKTDSIFLCVQNLEIFIVSNQFLILKLQANAATGGGCMRTS